MKRTMYRIGETEHEQEVKFKRQLCYNFHFEWGRFEKKTYISNENKFHFQMPTLLPASSVISSHTGFTFSNRRNVERGCGLDAALTFSSYTTSSLSSSFPQQWPYKVLEREWNPKGSFILILPLLLLPAPLSLPWLLIFKN